MFPPPPLPESREARTHRLRLASQLSYRTTRQLDQAAGHTGAELRLWRRTAGFSAAEVAEEAGRSVHAVEHAESLALLQRGTFARYLAAITRLIEARAAALDALATHPKETP
jgi:hypothetical protein